MKAVWTLVLVPGRGDRFAPGRHRVRCEQAPVPAPKKPNVEI